MSCENENLGKLPRDEIRKAYNFHFRKVREELEPINFGGDPTSEKDRIASNPNMQRMTELKQEYLRRFNAEIGRDLREDRWRRPRRGFL